MNLVTLGKEWKTTTGNLLGFMIKSLENPAKRFKVESKLSTGKFVIVNVETGKESIVDGLADRYDFAVPMARIREVKGELTELKSQYGVIKNRIGVLEAELGLIKEDLVG